MPDAHAIHARFKQLPGSEKIAKPLAIQGVIDVIRERRPQRILEIGTGIGTLTHAIIQTLREAGSPAEVICIEDNAFCLEQLRINLGRDRARITLLGDASGVPPRSIDFAIVDGGTLEHAGYADFLVEHGTMLVEGFREKQRNAVRAAGRRVAFTHVRSSDPGEGSYWLAQFEPSRVERARFWVRGAWSHWAVGLARRVRSH